MAKAEASYTRPSNTTQYTANDALSDSTGDPTPSPLTFPAVTPRGGGLGWITGLTVITTANQTTLPQLKVYIFDGDTAPTATNDNSEFGLTDANAAALRATFTVNLFAAADPTSGADGNAECSVAPDGDFAPRFECGAGLTNLWGLVKVTNAYTPVSGETFTFRLNVMPADL